jgi:hypothetical protein
MSLNKKIAEVGLTHEPFPLHQNHVIIHSGYWFAWGEVSQFEKPAKTSP